MAALALSACGLRGVSSTDGTQLTGSDVVRIVPEGERADEAVVITGASLGGRTLSTQDFAGRPVVLNYWYSYCPPCRKEAPELDAAYRRLSTRNVAFLGINIRDNEASARTFLTTFQVPYSTIFDSSGRAAMAVGISVAAVPTTVVLDSQHRVAAQVTGPVDARTLTQLVGQVSG